MSFSLKYLACATAILGGALILNGCGGSDSSLLNPPTISSDEKIVFVRPNTTANDPRGSGPIWIVDADGKNAKALTTGNDSQPTILLNKIAFVRDTSLWTMNVDGTEIKQVPTEGNFSFSVISDPAWKPNGNEISFSGQEKGAGFAHIYTINLKTNAITKVTGVGDNPDTSLNPPRTTGTISPKEDTEKQSDEYDPAWSSDGTQLVFATDRNFILEPGQNIQKNISELYKLTFSGSSSKLTRLTHHTANSVRSSTEKFNGSTGNPIFSDDGTTIAFESADLDTRAHIYTIPANGIAITSDKWNPVYSEGGSDTAPTYEPEKRDLAFAADGKILSLPDSSKTATPRTITQGVQPSWGKILVVTTPTTVPTTTPTTAPTTRPTTVPTTIPTTRPTATPTTPGGTNTYTGDLYPQDYVTLVKKADGSVVKSTSYGLSGDQESSGNGAIQSVGQYPLDQIPAGATVVSATLRTIQDASTKQGDPYGALGSLYVERATSLSLNEGNLATGALLLNSSPQTTSSPSTLDVTSLVKQAVSAGDSQLYVRLRFQKVRNNNGQNDLIQTSVSPITVIYTK